MADETSGTEAPHAPLADDPSIDDAPSGISASLAWVERDATAHRAMWLVWPLGLALIGYVGRDQWFIRDDWAFLFTRQRVREVEGWWAMVMRPQDGHWMVAPILVFQALRRLFGLGSYLPFLAVLWATHVGVVVLARAWMRRFGVSAWTTTAMSAVLLVFGAGWENLFFAVQIVYNFSLLAFLGQALLVDHDGPLDRRDAIGAALGLVSVSSSGFGPFFACGIGVLLVLRRRWAALAVAVVPQAAALGWWWLTWGSDPAGDAGSAGPRFVAHFVEYGIRSSLGSLVGSSLLGWSAALLCVAIVIWRATGWSRRAPMLAMLVTIVVMFAGIGTRREVFGVLAAAWPRYVYMAAALAAPTLAFGLDQARRLAPWARVLPVLLLALAAGRNARWMHLAGERWADAADLDRRVFELVAGSDRTPDAAQNRSLTLQSPDVLILDLAVLVDEGAITPEVPDEPAELQLVDELLGLTAPAPAP